MGGMWPPRAVYVVSLSGGLDGVVDAGDDRLLRLAASFFGGDGSLAPLLGVPFLAL